MGKLFRLDYQRDWKEAIVFIVLSFVWFNILGTAVAFLVGRFLGNQYTRDAVSTLFGFLSFATANSVLKSRVATRWRYLVCLLAAVTMALVSTLASLIWIGYLTTLKLIPSYPAQHEAIA